MFANNPSEKDKYINLSNIAAWVSFLFLLALTFAIVRNQFYYQILLHVPIFQYIDASEIVLLTPGTGLTWISFIGGLSVNNFLWKSTEFNRFQKCVFSFIILTFACSYFYISYRNLPVFKEIVNGHWIHKYWYFYIPLLILFIISFMSNNGKAPVFLQKNRFIAPLLLTVWYGFFEGWANYSVITTSKLTNDITVQTKSFGIIKTDSIIIDAGRTKNYWFFYNRKTHLTRAIKIDDVEFTDFDEENK